jgi:oxygen-independent coproporphyrinogen-3 oxidase
MAGIYIHVPYCRQACHYCDFHFSVKQETKEAYVNSLLREISLQKNYLGGERVETVYFGGGTPSLLSDVQLKNIFESLHQHFEIDAAAEVTLEANPDDLTKEKISFLKSTEINRLSIGIQSFFDHHLHWMNRAHHAQEAEDCVKRAQDDGFSNITIDLMYGLPDLSDVEWEQNLATSFALDIRHLSCYSLTAEPRTALAHFISTGKSKKLDEEQAARQFKMLMQRMRERGWLHYEISNFASEERFVSRHNSAYWKGRKYLGLGPSAHSFNGISRQWNARNNHLYIESITKGVLPYEREDLTETQRINERIMTELRTMWGLKISDFGTEISESLKERSQRFIAGDYVELNEEVMLLTDKGKLIADRIVLELMMEEE